MLLVNMENRADLQNSLGLVGFCLIGEMGEDEGRGCGRGLKDNSTYLIHMMCVYIYMSFIHIVPQRVSPM